MRALGLPLVLAAASAGCSTKINSLKDSLRSNQGLSSMRADPSYASFGDIFVHATSPIRHFSFLNEIVGGVGVDAVACDAPVLSDPLNFQIVSGSCPDLPKGGSCTFDVDATPSARGPFTADLSLTCRDASGRSATMTTHLEVNGVEIVLTLAPTLHDFGNVNVGSNSTATDFYFGNTGNTAATGCSAPVLDNTTDFSIIAGTCGTNDMLPLGTCIASVRANPAATGAKVATLSRTCTLGGTVSTQTNLITVTGIAPSLAWNPLTHDFGTVSVGGTSANQDFVLSNTGAAAATGCGLATLSDSTNFTIVGDTCAVANLGASASCTVTVRANPGSAGAKATTLSRTCTFGGTPTTTANQIIVTGGTPSLAWAPLTKDFGNVNVGSNSGTQVFTLSNTGSVPATGCSAPSISDATNFSITADTCATNDVTASGSCTVTVRANPGSVGSKVTTLSRTCTFGGTPTTTPNQIVVNGIAASLAWSPLTKDFGSVNVGS
ncbi:MAG: choice-of-anchor D domain-containing protein, partial [Bdellovibrionales bacterium]|nr:choice-of-anchor D domain-containing protein [Bdellovibrionales bacterium]